MANKTDMLVDRASALLDAAKRAGADAADAVAVQGASLSIEVRDGKVEESEQSEGDDLGLRVFVGRRSAIVSTNDMAKEGYSALADRAVAMAKLAPENEHLTLAPFADLATDIPDLDLVDADLPEAEALIERAKAAEAAALEVKGVSKSGSANAAAGLGGFVLVTSNGFSGARQRTTYSLSATAIAGEGTGMERDFGYHTAVHQSDLETPEEIGLRAGERAVARINPRKIETQSAPVIFDRRIASSLLGHLSSAINGAAIARGSSFLKEALGTQIFGPGIVVTDDPLVPRGLGSREFDGEGRPTRALSLIRNGELTSWILDGNTASQLGLASNGRASRGVSSNPSPSTTNLTLHEGDRAPSEMMAACGSGLLVTSMFGRGVDIITGDYSRGVSGFWFEKGEIAYPVSEITIASNLRDMFLSAEPANDLEIRGSTNSPTVLIGTMTIAGA